MQAGGRFTSAGTNGIVRSAVNELRELRRAIDLGQREFADLLSVPLETLRTWDSGRRPIPTPVLHRANVAETPTPAASRADAHPALIESPSSL